MKSILRQGRLASPRSGYWHPGELDWWFSYLGDFPPATTVWHDAAGPAGWVIVQSRGRGADTAIRPDLRGTPAEGELLRHVEQALGPGPVTAWAWTNDAARCNLLADLGYEHGEPGFQTFVSALEDPVEVPALPAGFRLLDAITAEWVAERAECHHRAFDPSNMTAEAYAAFQVNAPDYDPALDVAVASSDDRIVAYAMAWADAESGTGQLEPVGTRPHFWRRGLGRVANREALRRMQQRGLTMAAVNTYAGHAQNIAFYESCGFERVTTIDRWTKTVPG